jgi:hypothetical protein
MHTIHFQGKFARIAAEALGAIDQEKVKAAGFGELVRGAALAAQNAGITGSNVAKTSKAIILAKYSIQTDEQEMPMHRKTSGTTVGWSFAMVARHH